MSIKFLQFVQRWINEAILTLLACWTLISIVIFIVKSLFS